MNTDIMSFAAYLRKEERSAATIEKYVREAGRFLRWLDGRTAGKELALAYKEALMGERTPAGVNGAVAALNCLFSFWGLPECRMRSVKVQRRIFRDEERELTEKEYRVKTSPSEHGIEIFNMGEKPFVLENFEICYKKKLLVDCHMPEENRIILPYHNAIYTLSEQEADALQWHCQKEKFEECKVIAHSVDGKKAKGKLSVPLFAIRASIRTENHGSVD